jgi:hypothetical protein
VILSQQTRGELAGWVAQDGWVAWQSYGYERSGLALFPAELFSRRLSIDGVELLEMTFSW